MNAILIGPPGAGKGTQATILQDEYGFRHIASGDLLRAAVAAGADLGRQARRYIERGELVPDELVIGLILEQLQAAPAARGIVLDGFPRTLAQARTLERAFEPVGHWIDVVLCLDVAEEVLAERLTQREQCADCGAVYNRRINPPKQPGQCDWCGAGLYQRTDDNEHAVARRLEVYFSQVRPLIQHYESVGQLQRIDGNRPIREVTTAILVALAAARERQGRLASRW